MTTSRSESTGCTIAWWKIRFSDAVQSTPTNTKSCLHIRILCVCNHLGKMMNSVWNASQVAYRKCYLPTTGWTRISEQWSIINEHNDVMTFDRLLTDVWRQAKSYVSRSFGLNYRRVYPYFGETQTWYANCATSNLRQRYSRNSENPLCRFDIRQISPDVAWTWVVV